MDNRRELAVPDCERIDALENQLRVSADLKYPGLTTSTDWQHCLRILEEHWRSVALFGVAIFSVIAIVTYSLTPVYEATARLEIDPPGSEAFSLTTGSPGSIDSDYMDTQSEILKSDGLAIAVVRNLRLDRDPTIVGKEAAGTAIALLDNQVTSLTNSENIALRYYQGHLGVTPVRKSRVLEVKFATPDPRLSAQVVNTLVELFIEGNYKARYDATMHASEWLSRQMDDIRDKANSSSETLAKYQKEHGIVDVDGKQSSVSQKIADLNHQLAQAQTDRIQLQAYLRGIHNGHQESLPQARNNPMMQALTQHLIESKAELSQAQTVYGEKSPNIQKLVRQIDELQNQIQAEERKIGREIQTDYEAARSRETLMSQEIESATNEMSVMGQYSSLKREAERDADLYNSLYANIKAAGITAASKSSNVRLVDQARVLDRPTWPRRHLNLAIGLALALFGGIVIAFVRESFDSSVRTAEDVRKWIGLPSLTLVPTTTVMLNGRSSKKVLPAQTFFDMPFSPEAEAVRSLQTMVSRGNNPPRILLIASASPQEGKTTVAINLAVALSHVGSTCLVDADLRKSGVTAALHLKSKYALSDVLEGSVSLKDAMVGMPNYPHLAIVPAGVQSADRLLTPQRMRELLRVLNESCEYVVIDSPPLLAYADARMLASLVDGVVLVTRYGSTKRETVVRCAEILDMVRAPVLGVVLNAVHVTSRNYGNY